MSFCVQGRAAITDHHGRLLTSLLRLLKIHSQKLTFPMKERGKNDQHWTS